MATTKIQREWAQDGAVCELIVWNSGGEGRGEMAGDGSDGSDGMTGLAQSPRVSLRDMHRGLRNIQPRQSTAEEASKINIGSAQSIGMQLSHM
jgi:hypothetical protein